MEGLQTPGSAGPATEALSRAYANQSDRYNSPLASLSFQARTPGLYSTDGRGFSPTNGVPVREEGNATPKRHSATGDRDQGFQEHLNEYAMDQLAREWDGLLLGDGTNDIRNGGDVYRAMRKDMRSMACALKQSFGLVVDSRRYSAPGAERAGQQGLQPCVAELKGLAKELGAALQMAHATHHLQVDLTMAKNDVHRLTALLEENRLVQMAMQEELNALRAQSQRAAEAESKQASRVAFLTSINNELQAEAQNTHGELVEWRRRARELEERLEAQKAHEAALEAWLRELELQLLAESGAQATMAEDAGRFAAEGSAAPAGALGSGDEAGSGGEAAAASGGVAGPATGATASCERARLRELPPELHRLLGKVLRRRQAEEARLRTENEALTAELERLRITAASAAEAAPHGACSGGGAAATAGADGSPRVSIDSWNTEDFDWGSGKPAAAPESPHRSAQHEQQQLEQERQQHRQELERITLQLADARDAINRLESELTVAQSGLEQLSTAASESQALLQQQADDAMEAAAALRLQLAEAEVAAASQSRATAAAQEALAEARGQLAVLQRECLQAEEQQQEAVAAVVAELQQERHQHEQQLQQQAAAASAAAELAAQLTTERDVLATELAEARSAAGAAAAIDVERLNADNDRLNADLASALQLIASLESDLAASVAAQAELQARFAESEQRERRERQARDGSARELDSARQRLSRLQADMRELRAEAQVARGEATAASRDVKAANSEKLKAQREMEDALERLRLVEAAREDLAAQLGAAEAERRRLEQRLGEAQAVAAEAARQAQDGGEEKREQEEASRPGVADAAAVEEAVAAVTAALGADLAAAREELTAAQRRVAEERRGSTEERERLQAQLQALTTELATVRSELAAAQAASRERIAGLESQLARASAAEAEATEALAAAGVHASTASRQHHDLLASLQAQLAEAQERSAELEAAAEALRRDAEESSAAAEAASEAMEAHRAQAAAAQREVERRHGAELEEFRSRLAEAEAAAASAAAAAATAAAQASHAQRPSSPGAPSSSERAPGGEAFATQLGQGAVQRVSSSGEAGEEEEEEEREESVLALRARCRALRGELAVVRERLGALVEVAEAAARGRLQQVLEEAQQAAAAGEVPSEEAFWSRHKEMHSLHALASALRATALYHCAAGPTATYGDTQADGAGSVVGPTAGMLAARRRSNLLSSFRLRCGQVTEVLGEASTLLRTHSHGSPRAAASAGGAAHGPPASAGGSRVASGGGTSSSGDAFGSCRGTGDGAAAAASGGGHFAAAGAAAARAAAGPAPELEHSAGAYFPGGELSECSYEFFVGGISHGGDGGTGPASSALTTHSLRAHGAPGHGHGTDGSHPEGPGSARGAAHSSSFTSDTGSSLQDDDLASLSHLYELPPMASPPKFDFGELDLSSAAL